MKYVVETDQLWVTLDDSSQTIEVGSPDWFDWLRPSFPLLVVIYWSVALPQRYGTWTGWTLGLCMDVLRDVPMGTHALAFAVVAFAASQLTARMKVFPLMQQVMAVALLVGVGFVLVRIAGNLTGATTAALLPALVPVLTTAAVWPWAMAVQDRLRRAFNVN